MPLLTSVCNDKYLTGMLVCLYSLMRHNPEWKELPFKIYHREDLSKKSKKMLLDLHPTIQFDEITDPAFLGKDAHYMCLLPFKEIEEEKVIFIDCDVLVTNEMSGLLETQKDFAAVMDYEFLFPRKKHITSIPWLLRSLAYFNTGVYAIQGECLSEELFKELTSKINENAASRLVGGKKLWDQDIINEVLRHHDSEILPFTYNARKNLFKRGLDPLKVGTKVIHYTGGAKPWWTPGSTFKPLEGKFVRYKHIHKLWHDEREKFIDEQGYDPMDHA